MRGCEPGQDGEVWGGTTLIFPNTRRLWPYKAEET